MPTLILIALAGFAAQLVDGGLAWSFGVTSTTIFIIPRRAWLCGRPGCCPHSRTWHHLVSGFSHWRFGNIDWKIVFSLAIPGLSQRLSARRCQSNLSLDAARPITSAILLSLP